MALKLGSLFDGSGGFPLAGVINGIEPVWASEIEPYPMRVTTARFPDMKHLGDVTKIDGGAVEPVDIITFGSPCQDLSVAGKQAGLHKGERSNLFFEAIRIIKEMREATDGIYPRIAVWENVPGAYSSNKGEDFRAVLQAFCSVKDETTDVPRPAAGKWNRAGAIVGNGWSVAWRTFDAQYWGVPQRRKRIYLIADFGSERAGEILFEQNRVRRDTAESGAAGQGTSGDAEGSAGRGVQCLNPSMPQSSRIYSADGVYPCLSSNGSGGLNRQAVCFQQNQREEVRSLGEKTGAIAANAGAHQTNYVCEQIDLIRESRGAFETYEQDADKAGSLKQCDNKGSQVVCYAAAFKYGNSAEARGIGYQEEISPTLQAGEGGNQKPVVCYAVDRYNQTIADTMQTVRPAVGGDNVGAVCYVLQGNGIDRADTAGCNGAGWRENECYTLNTIDRPAVAYSVDCRNMNLTKEHGTLQAKENGGQSLNYMGAVCYALDRYNGEVTGDVTQTLAGLERMCNAPHVCYPIDSHQQDSRFKVCADGISPTLPGQMGTGGNNGPMVLHMASGQSNAEIGVNVSCTLTNDKDRMPVCYELSKPPRRYIIRRLTPLECCRLQGFPDCWCSGIEIENPTEEEIAFWSVVWETHRIAMGKSGKPKSRNQIIKWLRDPRSDSAEYKMWGNGIALPNAEFVVRQAKKLLTSK